MLACEQLLLSVMLIAIAPFNLEGLFEHAHQQVRLVCADRCLHLIHKQRKHSEAAQVLDFKILGFWVHHQGASKDAGKLIKNSNSLAYLKH